MAGSSGRGVSQKPWGADRSKVPGAAQVPEQQGAEGSVDSPTPSASVTQGLCSEHREYKSTNSLLSGADILIWGNRQ